MARMSLIQVGLTAAVVLICYKLVRRARRRHQLRVFALANGCGEIMDTTDPYPWTGFLQLRDAIKNGKDLLDDVFLKDFKVAFTLKKTVVDLSCHIMTAEPANIQALLATQFKDFDTGKLRHSMFRPVLGDSIFSSDGAFWEHSRALLRPQFSRDNINDLDETEHAASLLVDATGPVNAAGWTSTVDLQRLFYNFTLDTATGFMFGESVQSQAAYIKERNGNSEDKEGSHVGVEAGSAEFMESFAVASDFLISRVRLGGLYWLADSFKYRRAASQVRRFTQRFVHQALQASTADKSADEKKKNLLYALTTQTKDEQELQSQSVAVLFAGRDTTASLLGWCFLRLAQHPDIYAKLRKLILSTFPADEQITFAQLKSCRYLQHFINEVQRLHTITPFNNRVANKDTTLPVGGGPDQRSPIVVYKDQVVAFTPYLLHRRKDLWGEDALEFKPERWEQRIPAWQFVPFSGGPRICIGQQYALTETSYLIVKMLTQFDAMEPVGWSDAMKAKKGLGLTMWPGEGVPVKLHRAA